MFNLRDAKIEDFKVVENTQQVPANMKNPHVTFYRVKAGCHKSVAPKLEYCKLSEVLPNVYLYKNRYVYCSDMKGYDILIGMEWTSRRQS